MTFNFNIYCFCLQLTLLGSFLNKLKLRFSVTASRGVKIFSLFLIRCFFMKFYYSQTVLNVVIIYRFIFQLYTKTFLLKQRHKITQTKRTLVKSNPMKIGKCSEKIYFSFTDNDLYVFSVEMTKVLVK